MVVNNFRTYLLWRFRVKLLVLLVMIQESPTHYLFQTYGHNIYVLSLLRSVLKNFLPDTTSIVVSMVLISGTVIQFLNLRGSHKLWYVSFHIFIHMFFHRTFSLQLSKEHVQDGSIRLKYHFHENFLFCNIWLIKTVYRYVHKLGSKVTLFRLLTITNRILVKCSISFGKDILTVLLPLSCCTSELHDVWTPFYHSI